MPQSVALKWRMNADPISAFVLLFLVLDPLGNLPVVASLLRQVDHTRRMRVVLRECLIACLILLAFMPGARQFLDVMHLSEISLSIAGGVILFMIAIRMVFKRAMEAIERLMGLILTAIAIGMLLGGNKQFLLQINQP